MPRDLLAHVQVLHFKPKLHTLQREVPSTTQPNIYEQGPDVRHAWERASLGLPHMRASVAVRLTELDYGKAIAAALPGRAAAGSKVDDWQAGLMYSPQFWLPHGLLSRADGPGSPEPGQQLCKLLPEPCRQAEALSLVLLVSCQNASMQPAHGLLLCFRLEAAGVRVPLHAGRAACRGCSRHSSMAYDAV